MPLHPLNPHQGDYDFDDLVKRQPQLAAYLKKRPDGKTTLDFSQDQAVKLLNQALLQQVYGVQHWDIPAGYLCPPVPGRADYVCRIHDLLSEQGLISSNAVTEKAAHKNIAGTNIKGKNITGLDIGTGANVIYPIVGSQLFNWKFVGAELDATAFNTAKTLVALNKNLTPFIKVRRQQQAKHIFEGIIQADDYFDFTLCNPPFHRSAQDAQTGTQRKWNNLARSKSKRGKPTLVDAQQPSAKNQNLNFGGQSNELWCDGGEAQFIRNMISESVQFQKQVGWFTTLVSKKENLKAIYQQLKACKAREVKTIDMQQGNKQSRFVAWRF